MQSAGNLRARHNLGASLENYQSSKKTSEATGLAEQRQEKENVEGLILDRMEVRPHTPLGSQVFEFISDKEQIAIDGDAPPGDGLL